MKKSKIINQKGVTILESLFSLSILMLAGILFSHLFFRISLASTVENRIKAVNTAQNIVEEYIFQPADQTEFSDSLYIIQKTKTDYKKYEVLKLSVQFKKDKASLTRFYYLKRKNPALQ